MLMKTKLMLIAMFAVVFGLAISALPTQTMKATGIGVAMAADNWEEEGESEEADPFENIMQTTFATIEDVKFDEPAAGASAKVTATIKYDAGDDEKAKITTVKLVYSVNGGALAEALMVASAADTYVGEIPAQAAGAKIDFYVNVTDSNGNVTTGAISSDKTAVSAVDDIDNPADLVADDADIIGLSANYDNDYLYVNYNVQGKISGGTIDPPYIQLYGIKITNPNLDNGEGLMVGKLWVNLPLIKDKAVQDKFLPLLMSQAKEYIEKIGMENIDRVKTTGMLVLDITKLMGGNIADGLLFSAQPDGTADGGKFVGKIKRAPLGENPLGYFRIIVLTAANSSLDSFMPIPLNCSNFLTIYTKSYGYTAK